MACAVEASDALHLDGGGASAFDSGAHGDEQGGEVGDLGSRAQFSKTVSPSARTAAMRRSSVPVTVILSKTMCAPLRRSALASR